MTTPPIAVAEDSAAAAPTAWGLWLAWTWVLVLLLAVVATLGGFDDLRLALDVQRHFGAHR
jgi:hypothetical protein